MKKLSTVLVLAFACTFASAAEAQDAAAAGPRIGAAGGPCGGWGFPRDSAMHVVTIDVLVPDDPADRLEGPASDEAVERLSRAGAEIVHRFAVPYVRVRLPYWRVPGLESLADHFRHVPDVDRHFARVVVNYTRPETDADVALLTALGGRVEARMRGSVAAILPDAAISSLRSRPEVASVVGTRVMCIDF